MIIESAETRRMHVRDRVAMRFRDTADENPTRPELEDAAIAVESENVIRRLLNQIARLWGAIAG